MLRAMLARVGELLGHLDVLTVCGVVYAPAVWRGDHEARAICRSRLRPAILDPRTS